jgi:hypothetical protein
MRPYILDLTKTSPYLTVDFEVRQMGGVAKVSSIGQAHLYLSAHL